jgi:hypothetical protein
MVRYVWRNDRFVNRSTGEPMEAPDGVFRPAVLSDVTYKSPLSGKEVTSRSQRREEMKIHGVREMAPDEYQPTYRKKKNAVANRGEHNPDAGKREIVNEAPFQRLSRDDLPAGLRKSVENQA